MSNTVNRKADDIAKAESQMAYSNITELSHHLKELKSQLKPGEKLPEWVEAKLTLAADYLSRIAHYVDGAREAGAPLNKQDKLESLKSSLQSLKKNTINYKAPGMKQNVQDESKQTTINYKAPGMGPVSQGQAKQMQATTDAANANLKGVKDGVIGHGPAMTGVASKRQIGTAKSGTAIHSYFDHPDHSALTADDHGEAAQMHRTLRDELKPLVQSKQTNPKLLDHHQDQMMAHSKAQAQMKSSSIKR